MVEQNKLSAQERFLAALTEELQDQGYTVVPVPATREKAEFMPAYPVEAGDKADAYLDLVVANYGYIAAGIGAGTPYRPHFSVEAKLVSPADGALLMQEAILYNPVAPSRLNQAITLQPNPAYGFATFDSLVADGNLATRGLQEAAEETAKALGQLLK